MRMLLQEEEKLSVARMLSKLNPQSVERWEECKATHRFMAYERKQVIIYRLFMGEPSILDTLTCETAELSLKKGVTSRWRDTKDNTVFFSSTPVEVYPSIFLWHTFNSEVQYTLHNGAYNARFSMLYRCPHHPKILHEGFMYIQELSNFESEFGT